MEQQRSGDALLDKVGGALAFRREGSDSLTDSSLTDTSLLKSFVLSCLDPIPRGGAEAGAATYRVDRNVSVRLPGREDDALPQRHDSPSGSSR